MYVCVCMCVCIHIYIYIYAASMPISSIFFIHQIDHIPIKSAII